VRKKRKRRTKIRKRQRKRGRVYYQNYQNLKEKNSFTNKILFPRNMMKIKKKKEKEIHNKRKKRKMR